MAKIEGNVTISAEEYLTLLERSMDLEYYMAIRGSNWDGAADDAEPRTDKDDAILLAMVQRKLNA